MTKAWAIQAYACHGYAWGDRGERLHAKGCKRVRPLRMNLERYATVTVECATKLGPVSRSLLVRWRP